jgi:hypothetical protein
VVLRTVTGAELVEGFRNALSDVLYGFCVRYAEASKAALIATLNLPKFFARPGLLTESEKNLFVAAAVRQPVHPRQRFQDLVRDFARICLGRMPTEVLAGYQ